MTASFRPIPAADAMLMAVAAAMTCWLAAGAARAESSQDVQAGHVINLSSGGGQASMNAASTKGGIQGRNRQSVSIRAGALNAAVGGSAQMHLGSVAGGVAGANQQSVVVGGGVTNIAGPGGEALVGIGSRKSSVSGNRQAVVVGGSVTNIAGPGVTSRIEIDHR